MSDEITEMVVDLPTWNAMRRNAWDAKAAGTPDKDGHRIMAVDEFYDDGTQELRIRADDGAELHIITHIPPKL